MEQVAKEITLYTSYAVEITAAALIGVAILKVLFRYITFVYIGRKSFPYEKLRIEFGSSVAVALELMLGADVLGTAVAPSWSDIGQLAAIAIIRTALNYFLGKELKEIRTS
jgi:uncharacterized membrane protein